VLSRQDVPKFDPQIYKRIALNDLVTYAVYFLSQSDHEISAEDIVAACFTLFSERFALRGYPQWPDSTVVNKRWVDCRKRGLITGSTARSFSLTPKGLALAEKVGKTLLGQRPLFNRQLPDKARAEIRTRAGRFVRALEESDAYKLFRIHGEQAEISEFDFRSMLLSTMESSTSTLRNNLEQFKQYVSLYDRKDLSDFLIFCERKFGFLLTGASKREGEYRGGMLRQKAK
jgi:hypothetical protein